MYTKKITAHTENQFTTHASLIGDNAATVKSPAIVNTSTNYVYLTPPPIIIADNKFTCFDNTNISHGPDNTSYSRNPN